LIYLEYDSVWLRAYVRLSDIDLCGERFAKNEILAVRLPCGRILGCSGVSKQYRGDDELGIV